MIWHISMCFNFKGTTFFEKKNIKKTTLHKQKKKFIITFCLTKRLLK